MGYSFTRFVVSTLFPGVTPGFRGQGHPVPWKNVFGQHEIDTVVTAIGDVMSQKLTNSEGQWEFQDPIHGGTLVPYFGPYFLGIFPEI